MNCQVTPGNKTTVGYIMGNSGNNNHYDHLQAQGQTTGFEQMSGSGIWISPDYSAGGYGIYPFFLWETQAYIQDFWADVEDSEPNMPAIMLAWGNYAQTIVDGGQFPSGNNSSAPFAINSGAPYTIRGADVSGTFAEMLDVIGNSVAPSTITDSTLPSGFTSTNSGKTFYLRVTNGGQDTGMKFADLPSASSSFNGVKRYCLDCDPAANPPTTCTSSGTKTGAWVDGINAGWTCVP
jgi:hypothetical protein